MKQPLRILIAEDNPDDAELVLRELRRSGYEPQWERVDTEEAYLARLLPELDIILSDFEMPQFGGLRALELLRARGLDVPFIIISGTIGEDLAVEVMKQGATDYLLKDRLARLGPAVSHALKESRLRRERQQAEAQLRLLETCVERLNDLVLITEAEPKQEPGPRIIFVNEAFVRRTGYSREEVLGRSPRFLQGPKTSRSELDRIGAALRAWEPVRAELINYTKSGEEFWIELDIVPVADARGQFTHWVSVERDITERKQLEQQFFRAQRMESIGTLAGGIAHDLNNVLGPILLSLDLLKMRFPDAASQEVLSIISDSAQRGADMVRQVLSFARGVQGRRLEVQLRHLVLEIEKIANDTFMKQLRVRTVLPPELATVLGDPTQLHQVLMNLCVNARDAMPEGGTLTITAKNLTLDAHYAGLELDAKPGPYVLLWVEDTGSGIPPEVIEKIFDPFFTTKEVGKGTGLGLSTSLAIVKSHGGFIRVQSPPGKGTKFEIYLPASTEPSQEAGPEVAVKMPRGNGELILVVDDEASVRNVTRQTLEAYGYRVVLATDGVDAVSHFARHLRDIELVLTDMTMPVMDGPATIQVLRRMNAKVPIIATSGVANEALVARVMGLGVKHFLSKPFTAEVLLQTLETALSSPR